MLEEGGQPIWIPGNGISGRRFTSEEKGIERHRGNCGVLTCLLEGRKDIKAYFPIKYSQGQELRSDPKRRALPSREKGAECLRGFVRKNASEKKKKGI